MPTREDQISDRLDNEGRYARAQQLQDQENNPGINAGIDQAEAYANDPANATKNIDDARERESNSSYPAAGSVNNSWAQNYTGKKANKSYFPSKLSLKKKGPLGLIAGLVLGGGFGFSMLLAPGMGIVHLKEVLTEDLSDHLSAVTVRQDQLLRAKLKKIQAGASYCGSKVTIRCKFSTMSKREVERFRAAGFTDIKEDTDALGRKRITSMKAPNGEPINNPSDLINSKDPKMRGYLHKAMTPKYLSFVNPSGWMKRLGVSKAPQLEGTDKKSLDESFNKATSGDTFDGGSTPRKTQNDNDGKGNYVVDDDGSTYYENDNPDKFNEVKNKPVENAPKASELAKKADVGSHTGNFLRSAAKGVSVTGVADTACTVYNTSRAVSAASKVVRAAQLASFAMVFLNTADKIKAGDAKPEEVSYLGDNLTYVDQREMITDEKSVESMSLDSNKQATVELGERKNPYYGKSAFDSAGYKVGAFNDAPILNSRDMSYVVGGGLMGTFDSVNAAILSTLGTDNKGVRSKCEAVQSWWARGAGLAAGLVVGGVTLGTGTAVMIGASVAIGFAMPFLISTLADILAGKVVDSNTKGVDSGNAIFAGTAVLSGEIAKDYGMKPASKEDFTQYLASTQDVRQQNIDSERVLAQTTPFDIYNKYSFLGSLSRSVYPALTKAKQQPVMAFLSSPLQIGESLSQLSLSANAASSDGFNQQRFERCKDEGYAELGIDADVFCNVRYSLSDKELNMDPEQNVQWMIDNNYITEEGEPADGKNGDTFKDWITYCAEREDGWGETSEEEGGDIGEDCVKDSDPYPHFRVFRMDQKIDSSMSGENKQTVSTGNVATGDAGSAGRPEGAKTFRVGWTFADGQDVSSVPCAAGTVDAGLSRNTINDVDLRICSIGGKEVSSVISESVVAMFKAAKSDGITLSLGSGYRSTEKQQQLYNQNCSGGICSPPTARPGSSQHEMGLALDIAEGGGGTICFPRPGSQCSSAAYKWLVANAKKYGFFNLPSEAWHWSTSGG